MVPVETGSNVILCFDNQQMRGNVRAEGTRDCICQECDAQFPTLIPQVNGKASKPHARNRRITRQFFLPVGSDIRKLNMTRRQRVITRNNTSRILDRQKTRSNPSLSVLSSLCLQVAIQWLTATGKAVPVLIGKRHHRKRAIRHMSKWSNQSFVMTKRMFQGRGRV